MRVAERRELAWSLIAKKISRKRKGTELDVELAGEVTSELQVVGKAASMAIQTWVRNNDKAVRQDGSALQYACDALRSDRGFVLDAVLLDANALQHAATELTADRELVLAAIEQDGLFLQDAAPELRADREVVLAAVQQTWDALPYASEELKADRKVVIAAMHKLRRARVRFVSHSL